MNKRAILFVSIILWSVAATAQQACEQKEYAQLKDEAARGAVGRMLLTHEYCRAAIQGCPELQSKIITALNSVNDTASVTYALGKCKGEAPMNGPLYEDNPPPKKKKR